MATTRPDTLDSSQSPSARSRRAATVVRIVRRVHLYSGLFMLPWVLLYGVTALLLNHRTAFPDAEVQNITQSDLAGTALEELPTAAELAARITARLRASAAAEAESGRDYALLNPEAATYSGKMFLSGKGGGRKHSITFDPAGPQGAIQTRADVPPSKEAFQKTVELDANVIRQCERGLAQVLANHGLTCDRVRSNFAPKMKFRLAVDGRPFQASYDLRGGVLLAEPLDAPSEMSMRQFLVKLHFAHKYPAEWNAAWLWAVAVDAMFVSMVFWGGSGLLMWWQIKRARMVGGVLLVASGCVAAGLALGMHRMLAG